jgi:hypothetical protein
VRIHQVDGAPSSIGGGLTGYHPQRSSAAKTPDLSQIAEDCA